MSMVPKMLNRRDSTSRHACRRQTILTRDASAFPVAALLVCILSAVDAFVPSVVQAQSSRGRSLSTREARQQIESRLARQPELVPHLQQYVSNIDHVGRAAVALQALRPSMNRINALRSNRLWKSVCTFCPKALALDKSMNLLEFCIENSQKVAKIRNQLDRQVEDFLSARIRVKAEPAPSRIKALCEAAGLLAGTVREIESLVAPIDDKLALVEVQLADAQGALRSVTAPLVNDVAGKVADLITDLLRTIGKVREPFAMLRGGIAKDAATLESVASFLNATQIVELPSPVPRPTQPAPRPTPLSIRVRPGPQASYSSVRTLAPPPPQPKWQMPSVTPSTPATIHYRLPRSSERYKTIVWCLSIVFLTLLLAAGALLLQLRLYPGPLVKVLPQSNADTEGVLLIGKSAVIGRRLDADLVLASSKASRNHARIWRDDTGTWIQDLNSENGTYVNGDRIGSRRLYDSDEVRFADEAVVLRLPT